MVVKEVPLIEALIVIVTCSILSILLTIMITRTTTSEEWREYSVKAGKAEYYLDENNDKQWRWK